MKSPLSLRAVVASVFLVAVFGWYSAADQQDRHDFVRELFSSQR